MKLQILVSSLLAGTVFISSECLAGNKCYQVSGNSSTTNITETVQVGNISLTLTDVDNQNKVVFSSTGTLVGMVTGTTTIDVEVGGEIIQIPVFFLSHTAEFDKGFSFTTQNDIATVIQPINECSMIVKEDISFILKGDKIFSKLQPKDDDHIIAIGEFNSCLDENENTFEFSGQVCEE